MRQFVGTLSSDTGYRRLLSPRTPTDDELRRWTDIDTSRECALVAVTIGGDEPRIAAVARYVHEADGDADFAIVVHDAWQGRGVGRQLLTRLIAAARLDGVRRLTGITLAENRAMLSLARALGFRLSRSSGIETRLVVELSC
jgi:acetyltransferase